MISLPGKKDKPEWILPLTSDLKAMSLPHILKGKKPYVGSNKCHYMNKAMALTCMVKCRFKKQVK
jgi:hypothetical protein